MFNFKNIFLAALATVAVLLTPSCESGEPVGTPEEEQPVEINLYFSDPIVTMPAEGGWYDITISTNAETIEFINAISWVEVEQTSNNTISVYASENTSNSSRKGDILVVATAGKSVKERAITIEQVASGGTTAGGNLTFECPVFEELVLTSFDTNGDGVLSANEAAIVTELDVTLDETSEEEQEAITSLKGIKNFVNLKYLYCAGNLITSLDVSGMEQLEYIECDYNKITKIDASGCKSLKWLYFNMNNVATVLIEGCDNLMFFQGWKNNLTTIDLSNKPEMVYLDIRMNSLRDIKFENCPKLQVAALGSNKLISLNLKGLPSLYTLGCYDNNIASLDLRELPNLEMLECYTNNIATLDLSANKELVTLSCQNNLISELNLGDNTKLKKIECANNRLTGEVDYSKYTALEILSCGGNNFTAINVNGCKALKTLSCENTNITALEVSALTALETLVANDCRISVIDCSNNLKLTKLHLQGNPLTSLVLANGQSIYDLKVDNYDVISYK